MRIFVELIPNKFNSSRILNFFLLIMMTVKYQLWDVAKLYLYCTSTTYHAGRNCLRCLHKLKNVVSKHIQLLENKSTC